MRNLPKVIFHPAKFKFKDEKILCLVRKEYVKCTPEEWVRQNLIKYLSDEKNYFLSRMKVEKSHTSGGREYRADLTCYDKKGSPYLIAECKAPGIALSQTVLDQIGWYNTTYKARYLLVTNGIDFLVYETKQTENNINPINYIPKIF